MVDAMFHMHEYNMHGRSVAGPTFDPERLGAPNDRRNPTYLSSRRRSWVSTTPRCYRVYSATMRNALPRSNARRCW